MIQDRLSRLDLAAARGQHPVNGRGRTASRGGGGRGEGERCSGPGVRYSLVCIGSSTTSSYTTYYTHCLPPPITLLLCASDDRTTTSGSVLRVSWVSVFHPAVVTPSSPFLRPLPVPFHLNKHKNRREEKAAGPGFPVSKPLLQIDGHTGHGNTRLHHNPILSAVPQVGLPLDNPAPVASRS
ncbi:hypothetical protein PoB_001587000 [Plakobranchus ocellatus]|uniref:Uncharacterized protein n=1 Tax=Plakobranchus ocellatus TaxID=259542 RepID=A0AAV3Z417_9GAST|nr:hypothetical protein PoB_001587000 [Plakobranchus ocellatus]